VKERHDTPWLDRLILGFFVALWLTLFILGAGAAAAFGDAVPVTADLVPAGADIPNAYQDLDSYAYVEHAQRFADEGGLRYRTTAFDNAPAGRDVHWASGLLWLLRGVGWLRHLATNRPLAASIDAVAPWLNPILGALLLALAVRWALRRFGPLGGIAVGGGMVAQSDFFASFAPAVVDHHGVAVALGMGSMLALTAAGGGWVRTDGVRRTRSIDIIPEAREARRFMVASGILGGLNIWLSISTQLLVLFGIGAGVALSTLLYAARPSTETTFRLEPALWRLWSRAGALTCLALYLLEYFPNHLSMRLEINHPLYAAAWWGGGEFLALLGEWRHEGRLAALSPRAPIAALAGLALALPALLVLCFGPLVYTPTDPFLATLHANWIYELRPLTAFLTELHAGYGEFFVLVGATACSLLFAPLLLRLRHKPPAIRAQLCALWVASAFCAAVAMVQMRWFVVLPAMLVPMMLAALPLLALDGAPRQRGLSGVVLLPVFCAAMLCVFPVSQLPSIVARRDHVELSDMGRAVLCMRDLALSLRRSRGERPVTLLTSPSSSIVMGALGHFRVVGTLYWENLQGLKNAASVYAAASNEEAAELVTKLGITHIAIVEWESFIEPYVRLHLGEAYSPAKLQGSFGLRLAEGRDLPAWLKRLPYQPPSVYKKGVALYEVDAAPRLP
jgi:hypothetical protein